MIFRTYGLIHIYFLCLLSLLTFTAESARAQGSNYFGIVGYAPTEFREQPSRPFFFKIGNKVKFGTQITEEASTVFDAGRFNRKPIYVNPSPSQRIAAVVFNDGLYVVEAGKPARLLIKDFVFPAQEKLHIGQVFYREFLRWDYESKYLFILRDKKQNAQYRSKDATIVRIDISDATEASLVSDVISLTDLVVLDKETVCYAYFGNDLRADTQWRCSNGKQVKQFNKEDVLFTDGTSLVATPFWSYVFDGEAGVRCGLDGFRLKQATDPYSEFFSKSSLNTPLFRIKGGHNFKGRYVDGFDCLDVLPGGRYAFVNLHHDKFKGPVLVDGSTGQYKELPPDTMIFSGTYSDQFINSSFNVTSAHNFSLHKNLIPGPNW